MSGAVGRPSLDSAAPSKESRAWTRVSLPTAKAPATQTGEKKSCADMNR